MGGLSLGSVVICCRAGYFIFLLKGAVYGSYVKPAILCGSEAWCLKESEMGILRMTETSMVRAMCEVQLKDNK